MTERRVVAVSSSPKAAPKERREKNVIMKTEYLYKGYKITAWAVRKFGGMWNGGAILGNHLVTQGTSYEEFPTPAFNTATEAIDAAKKLAEDLVDKDNPRGELSVRLSDRCPSQAPEVGSHGR
jgi:hypothetical protein